MRVPHLSMPRLARELLQSLSSLQRQAVADTVRAGKIPCGLTISQRNCLRVLLSANPTAEVEAYFRQKAELTALPFFGGQP
jgi:hypothetical protein